VESNSTCSGRRLPDLRTEAALRNRLSACAAMTIPNGVLPVDADGEGDEERSLVAREQHPGRIAHCRYAEMSRSMLTCGLAIIGGDARWLLAARIAQPATGRTRK